MAETVQLLVYDIMEQYILEKEGLNSIHVIGVNIFLVV